VSYVPFLLRSCSFSPLFRLSAPLVSLFLLLLLLFLPACLTSCQSGFPLQIDQWRMILLSFNRRTGAGTELAFEEASLVAGGIILSAQSDNPSDESGCA